MTDGTRLQPIRLASLDAEGKRRILERATDSGLGVEPAVRDIMATVRERGDEGLLELTERFDKVRPPRLLMGPTDFDAALARTERALSEALSRAARNLLKVIAATRPPPVRRIEVEPGLVVEERHEPLDRVGCYVPGGKASYPSSVLMTAVPAKAAGVPDVIVASPPGPDGKPPDAVLAACAVAGADRLLVAGGAQAVAALAYGTGTVPRVDKIVGPGNRYVTAAKRLAFGAVGIVSPAGPTEVVVLADETADPRWVALDLVAQAEHAEDSRAILVTTSAPLAEAVAERLQTVARDAARRLTVTEALARHGALLVATDRDEACAFVREYAPEHLEIHTRDPDRWADLTRTAAATFLGPWTPVPAGDYLTGANHVLPTGAAARWSSPLGVHDFMVRRTRQFLTRDAARALASDLGTLARSEGLTAHAEAMEARGSDPQATARGPPREARA